MAMAGVSLSRTDLNLHLKKSQANFCKDGELCFPQTMRCKTNSLRQFGKPRCEWMFRGMQLLYWKWFAFSLSLVQRDLSHLRMISVVEAEYMSLCRKKIRKKCVHHACIECYYSTGECCKDEETATPTLVCDTHILSYVPFFFSSLLEINNDHM